MTNRHSESVIQVPPSDVERTQVLARLIIGRIAELQQLREFPADFTPVHARELFVLENLRKEWLGEGQSG